MNPADVMRTTEILAVLRNFIPGTVVCMCRKQGVHALKRDGEG